MAAVPAVSPAPEGSPFAFTNLDSTLLNLAGYLPAGVDLRFHMLMGKGYHWNYNMLPEQAGDFLAVLANGITLNESGTLMRWRVYESRPVQVKVGDALYVANTPVEGFIVEKTNEVTSALLLRVFIPFSTGANLPNYASVRSIVLFASS